MASPTQWTWVWVNSRSRWWTGRPGVLQSMWSQRVGHDWVTELSWTCMKCSVGISHFLEEISSLSHSIVFLYFFALITEEGFLISPCYSLELCIQMGVSFLFSFTFSFFCLSFFICFWLKWNPDLNTVLSKRSLVNKKKKQKELRRMTGSDLWQVKDKFSLETRKSSKTNGVLSKGCNKQGGRGHICKLTKLGIAWTTNNPIQ